MGIRLNDQQKQFVDSDSKYICCVAGAGSGKTASLIQRVGRLIKDNRCKGSNILVLTFTNAAAFEMKDRFGKQFKEFVADSPEFRTFHAFCFSLLCKDMWIRNKLGYTGVPEIITPEKLKALETKCKLMTSCKLTDKELHNPDNLDPNKKFMYEVFNKCLRKEARKQNVITFDMLCNDVCRLFESDDPVVQKYKDQYKYIIIDEFQDTDTNQWRFVKSFKDSNIAVVGDCLQTLYRFRGCTPEILMGLTVDPQWETIKLFENYRSTNQIVDYANNMSKFADDSYRIEMHGQRAGCEVVTDWIISDNRYQPVDSELLDRILLDISGLEGSVAILCRTNREVTCIVESLKENEIDVSTGKTNEEAAQLFTAARDNEYLINWLTSYFNAELYANWIRTVKINNCEDDLGLQIKLFKEFVKKAPQVAAYLARIYKIRQIVKSGLQPENQISNIINDNAKQLLTVLKLRDKSISRHDFESMTDVVKYVDELIAKNSESDIYVGTIHSSKGLEYDNVILVNVDGYTFNLKDEDNKYCFYVGITRARNKLKVYMVDR